MLKKRFLIKSKKSEVHAIKQDKEKYKLLQPKLEVISQRLGKLANDGTQPQDLASPRSIQLSDRKEILFINDDGDIIVDADKFFDILDKNNDGVLSFEEINTVLCLEDARLREFIASMRSSLSAASSEPEDHDKVARTTFTRHFLDALANASQLQPTEEESGEIFDLIAEEVGTTSKGEIEYSQLYNSYLSSFLNDKQVYGIISSFKRQTNGILPQSSSHRRLSFANSAGISRHDFVKYYPQFLSDVTKPDFMNMRTTLLSSIRDFMAATEELDGLDVAFDNLTLTVTVGNSEKVVVNQVSGRLRSNTMTAVMGGSGSGKSSLLNALCGRAFYGKVTGDVYVNGCDSKIENHKSSIGFVPQEDIVYADLTVRENLVRVCSFYAFTILAFSIVTVSYLV
jgi:ABC-type multidrug transport system fused ATPase/permease subunit